MNVRDVHDDSTADSLLCMLLDHVGEVLQHTITATIAVPPCLEDRKHLWHCIRHLAFETSCSRLPFLVNHHLPQESIRRVLPFFCAFVLNTWNNQHRCVCGVQESPPARSKSGVFLSNDQLVQCACCHIVVKKNGVTAIWMRNHNFVARKSSVEATNTIVSWR